MTQQLTWLVKVSEGESFNQFLTLACRGNDKVATLLNVLLFEGAIVANRQSLVLDQIEYVRLHLENRDIVKGLDRLHRHASVPTIINWMKKLAEWGYIKADGYRHQYDLYFHKIAQAFQTPPPKEVHPPRGRHAHKRRIEDLTFENGETSEDLNFDRKDLTFDYMNRTKNGQVETLILCEEMLKLQSTMKEFKSEIKKLKSDLSHERACRQALEAKVEALYNLLDINTDINLNERNEDSTPSPPNSFDSSRNLNPVATQGDTVIQSPSVEVPDAVELGITEGHNPSKPKLEQPCVITQEAQIIAWAEKHKVYVSNDAERVEKAMKVLLPLVRSEQDIIDLKTICMRRWTGTISLGNLAHPLVIDEWQRSQAGCVDVHPNEADLTEETRNALEDEIWQEFPMLLLQHWEVDDRPFLVMWYGAGEEDYILLGCRARWIFLQGQHGRKQLEQAIAYGLWLWEQQGQQEAVPQMAEVAA